ANVAFSRQVKPKTDRSRLWTSPRFLIVFTTIRETALRNPPKKGDKFVKPLCPSPNLPVKPKPRVGPDPLCRARCQPKGCGGFRHRHADEIAQFDQFSGLAVFAT